MSSVLRVVADVPVTAVAVVVVGAAAGRERLARTGVRGRLAPWVPSTTGHRPASRWPWPTRAWLVRRPGWSHLAPWGSWWHKATETEHAELLESVARSLRAGSSLSNSLDQAVAVLRSPARDELAGVLVRVSGGAPLVPALDAWAAGDDPARLAAGAALAFGAEVGGARARALEAAATGLRDRAALGGEIRALTAQARVSAAVMVAAPVVFVAATSIADPHLRTVFTTPLGAACLAGGLGLDAFGAWWMAWWIRSVT